MSGGTSSGGQSASGGRSGAPKGGGSGGAATSTSGGATSKGGAAASSGTTGKGGATSKGGATAAGGANGGAGTAGTASSIDCLKDGDAKTTLAFVNRCSQSVTFAGSDIKGGSLASGAAQCVDVGNASDAISSKRYWGYTGDDPGAGKYSLAEFTFNTDFQDFDWYNISYVDAFNLPMQIVPVARTNCKSLTCAEDFLSGCPDVGRFEKGGKLVACVNPSRDDGANPVAKYFESCDESYAWSGDDQNGSDPSPVRACAGEDFEIVFCPAGKP
ncbi:MAG TPA: thaumatin family protein [Polyangiaceae bacterium]|nr:thaumatin family protein [Polyangiaceae bacterium]